MKSRTFILVATTVLAVTAPRVLQAQTPTFCAPSGTETLQTDKAHYADGDTVQVSGTGYAAACAITATVTAPNGTAIGANGLTDAQGRFSLAYPVASGQGVYRVDALLGDAAPWNSATFTSGGYLATDMPAYAAGNRVTLSGGGWLPGEAVMLVLQELDGPDAVRTYVATADATGTISNGEFETDLQDAGVRFRVTATGQSSGHASDATFTDGVPAGN